MGFKLAFIERVKQLIGLTSTTREDFSFFAPGGNDQFIHFLLLTLPTAYLELEKFDRFSLLFVELNEQIGDIFQLDQDCQFATLVKKDQNGTKTVQMVMDLRDQNLIPLYCFGDPKSFGKLSDQLLQSPYLHNCFIDSNSLISLGNSLEHVSGINFFFEQTSRTHLQPRSLTGTASGNLARHIFCDQIVQAPQNFNLRSITGCTVGGQGKVTFQHRGELHIDTCKVAVFFKTAELIYTLLKQKYEYLNSKIQRWNDSGIRNCLNVKTDPVVLKFMFPLDKVDGLIRYFTRGIMPLVFFGTWERLSLALWRVFVTDSSTKEQISIEISDKMVRIFMDSHSSIYLIDKIESFITSHISPLKEDIYADFEQGA